MDYGNPVMNVERENMMAYESIPGLAAGPDRSLAAGGGAVPTQREIDALNARNAGPAFPTGLVVVGAIGLLYLYYSKK